MTRYSRADLVREAMGVIRSIRKEARQPVRLEGWEILIDKDNVSLVVTARVGADLTTEHVAI